MSCCQLRSDSLSALRRFVISFEGSFRRLCGEGRGGKRARDNRKIGCRDFLKLNVFCIMAAVMFVKLFNFAGSLCFLLYGMKLMSDGIQKSAGQRLQSALAFMTGNRFAGLLTGCLLTMIIQSSGATTVMLVSFVNAGLLTLEQAVGVVFGANIGTTITAWIVALFGFNFKIEFFAVPIFGIGYLLSVVKIRGVQYKGIGQAVMGFGILFIGLGWLSSVFQFNAGVYVFMKRVQDFGVFSIVLAVLIGVVFTALIHSSSAMSAIVITMAYNKVASWQFSAAVVIGSSIGSTVDAVLASVGTNADARRAALIHLLFNCATVCIVLSLFRPFLAFVDFITPGTIESNIAFHIAMINTVFNVLGSAVFLPFTKQIAKLTRKIIKDDSRAESKVYKLEFNSSAALASPEVCVIRVQKEIADFTDVIVEMFDSLQTVIKNRERAFVASVYETLAEREDYTDQMHEQITQYLIKCSHLNIMSSSKDNVSLMMQVSEELESIADGCLSIAGRINKAVEKNMPFKQDDLDKLLPYFELVRQLLYFIQKNVARLERLSAEQFDFASDLESQIDNQKTALKKIARKRLQNGADVKAELLYIDIVRQIEKMGDRCFEVAGDLVKPAGMR